MTTIYLTFPDEATAQYVLSDYYSAQYGWDRASLTHTLDPVGVLYKNDAIVDAQGVCTKQPTQVAGWHVNFIGDLPSSASDYELNPAKPKRIFAE
jgi:hypothetical protein